VSTTAITAAEVLHDLTDDVSELNFKNMFSWRCTFFQGNMQAGYQDEHVMLRLSETDRREFLKLPNTELFDPKGDRPMKEYVSVPAEVLHSDTFASWFEKSLQYVASLPPKAKKAKAKPGLKRASR